MKLEKEEKSSSKLSLDKFRISKLTDLNAVKGGGDWTVLSRILEKEEEEEGE